MNAAAAAPASVEPARSFRGGGVAEPRCCCREQPKVKGVLRAAHLSKESSSKRGEVVMKGGR